MLDLWPDGKEEAAAKAEEQARMAPLGDMMGINQEFWSSVCHVAIETKVRLAFERWNDLHDIGRSEVGCQNSSRTVNEPYSMRLVELMRPRIIPQFG